MDFVYKSHIGLVRKNNEDCCQGEILEIDENKEIGIFAIADGMGGHNKGEVASQLAVGNIVKFFHERLVDNGEIKIEYIEDMIVQAYNIVNSMVYEKSREDSAFDGMGTTLTMAIVYDNHAYIANVGDSRCYIFRNKETLDKITTDHSIVEEFVKANIITEEEARVHPDRNKITRAVGTEPVVVVDIFTSTLNEGDMVLLATDGLTGAVDKSEIEAVLREDATIEEISDNLIDLANSASGKDNVTVVIVTV